MSEVSTVFSYASRRATVRNEVAHLEMLSIGQRGSDSGWGHFEAGCARVGIGSDRRFAQVQEWRGLYEPGGYEVDMAALWAEFPAGNWNGSARLYEALYTWSGLACTVARAMRCRKRSSLVGMYDVLLGVDNKYEGILSLLTVTSSVMDPITSDRVAMGAVTLSHLGCIVNLVEKYRGDDYALSTLASFMQKEAAFGVSATEDVPARYANVENLLLALRRGISAG